MLRGNHVPGVRPPSFEDILFNESCGANEEPVPETLRALPPEDELAVDGLRILPPGESMIDKLEHFYCLLYYGSDQQYYYVCGD